MMIYQMKPVYPLTSGDVPKFVLPVDEEIEKYVAMAGACDLLVPQPSSSQASDSFSPHAFAGLTSGLATWESDYLAKAYLNTPLEAELSAAKKLQKAFYDSTTTTVAIPETPTPPLAISKHPTGAVRRMLLAAWPNQTPAAEEWIVLEFARWRQQTADAPSLAQACDAAWRMAQESLQSLPGIWTWQGAPWTIWDAMATHLHIRWADFARYCARQLRASPVVPWRFHPEMRVKTRDDDPRYGRIKDRVGDLVYSIMWEGDCIGGAAQHRLDVDTRQRMPYDRVRRLEL